jgi:hypothetical protein
MMVRESRMKRMYAMCTNERRTHVAPPLAQPELLEHVARLERHVGREALRVRDEHGDVAELVALRALAREHAPGALRLRGSMRGLRERAQVLGCLRRRRGSARGEEDVLARAGERGRGKDGSSRVT